MFVLNFIPFRYGWLLPQITRPGKFKIHSRNVVRKRAPPFDQKNLIGRMNLTWCGSKPSWKCLARFKWWTNNMNLNYWAQKALSCSDGPVESWSRLYIWYEWNEHGVIERCVRNVLENGPLLLDTRIGMFETPNAFLRQPRKPQLFEMK